MALKSKKNTGLKGYVEGGLVDPQDPLVKKTTTKPPVVKVVPAAAYNPDIFSAEMEKLKGQKLKVAKSGDFAGNILIPKGALTTQVPALTTSVKTTQDYLFDYMKKNKKEQLSSKEADALLVANNMGSYDDYIAKAKNLKAYRDITVVPAKALDQSVDIGLTTQNAGQGGGYTMEPTTPFDSTHYEYTFPKNTYKQPVQKKAKGGEVNGKGIKGYIEGGDIQEQSTRTAGEKQLSKKPKDYIHDVGLGIVDWSLQGIGAQDVIKAEDYNTKQGVDTNRLNSGVGAVGSAFGGVVLDYYVPGLGTAVRGGKKGIGKMAGEDEGISDKDKATMAKIDTMGNIGGGLASTLGAKKKSNTGTEEVTATETNVDENGIDTTTGEIAVTDTNTSTTPQQVTSGDNLTGQALTDWKSALTGEAKASVLAKYNSGGYSNYAKGGKIIGAGHGKSDSIPAEPEKGGFVVPIENAKLAEEIREKHLGKNPNQIATLKVKGGAKNTRLSNGEHMFTKAEADLLRSKGVDLDALAPNAESSKPSGLSKMVGSYEMKKGGEVPADIDKAKYAEWYKTKFKPTNEKGAGLESAYEQYRQYQAEQDSLEADSNWAKQSAINKKATEVAENPLGTASATDETKPPATTKEKTNPFKQMDIGKGIALAQTGLGLQQLLQDGERPVDSLDADFVKTVDEAKADSQFGFTPLQMQIANRGIEKNRAADEQTIINLSGGSAGTALANIRAAGIAANDAKANLTAQSEALRLQKKRYADSQVANKANMSKQLFNEKLNAFNVDQQAGAGLLGAGIQNVIGASRLDREIEAQKKRESMYNPTFNIA